MGATSQRILSPPTLAVAGGTLRLCLLDAPSDLEGLRVGDGLGAYCRYRPGGTLAILRRVLGAPGGRLAVALAGDTLVAHLGLFQPDPEERWGRRPQAGLLELGTLEVDRSWRRRGVARSLLAALCTDPRLEAAILLAPQFAADWDLGGTGLTAAAYRQLVLRLFRRRGFAEFVTDEPLITADPMNCLLVRVGREAPAALYDAFRAALSEGGPPAPPLAEARHQHFLGSGLTSIRQINQLPAEEREAIYRRLIPPRVVALLALDPRTGRDAAGNRLVTYVCPADQGFARIEVRDHVQAQDCTYLLKLTQPGEEFVEIGFIIVNDPRGERFAVDRDPAGHPVGMLAGARNRPEEVRAMRAGLAPGQVRRGLRLFREVLPLVESFAAALGKAQVSIEALHYHHAFLYEGCGFGYLTGRDLLEEIHQGFEAGGVLAQRLDGSTPFRMPEAAATVRGRSWAIHDGILGEPWRVPRLYKIVGQAVGLPTFGACPY
jgi:GNAT superfamily N-acetyltransferase